ncbi:carboxymuconolactone decarboxylase family protein [Cohnella sp.]|uniref:carboxymuconolactone decarboxylase family protein n=1 Tax=Cohnella sp. TaxID=1883426 RepID=UPI00356886E7
MDAYYKPSNLGRIPELIGLVPQAAGSFLKFEHDVYRASDAVPLKTKELIAVAVAHVTGCPYCIDNHVKKYRSLGGTREEIVEAVLVAASTRAGAVLSHATQALIAFERNDPMPDNAPASPKDGTSAAQSDGPECLC